MYMRSISLGIPTQPPARVLLICTIPYTPGYIINSWRFIILDHQSSCLTDFKTYSIIELVRMTLINLVIAKLRCVHPMQGTSDTTDSFDERVVSPDNVQLTKTSEKGFRWPSYLQLLVNLKSWKGTLDSRLTKVRQICQIYNW